MLVGLAAVVLFSAMPQQGGGEATAPPVAAASPALARVAPVAADTPVRRPRPVEYSDGYARRLAVHRVASYTMLPLFALQSYTGAQLMKKGADAPEWVIRSHGPIATAMLVVFSVNTVTGAWNLWEARRDPSGRTTRWVHGLLMLAADAGFLTAGYLSKPAETSSSMRSLHRTVALSSIAVSLVSYAIMLPPLRR